MVLSGHLLVRLFLLGSHVMPLMVDLFLYLVRVQMRKVFSDVITVLLRKQDVGRQRFLRPRSMHPGLSVRRLLSINVSNWLKSFATRHHLYFEFCRVVFSLVIMVTFAKNCYLFILVFFKLAIMTRLF